MRNLHEYIKHKCILSLLRNLYSRCTLLFQEKRQGEIIMSGFTDSPKVVRGALVVIDTPSSTPQVIAFQYNPDSMTRSLQVQGSGSSNAGDASPIDAFRIKATPIETINIEVEIDASDQLEHPDQNPSVVDEGILPQLSALEILLYPSSQYINSVMNAAFSGTLEVVPPEGPFLLFVWGPKRILPVHLTKFDITEEAFDTNLNPIRAKVALGLRVLSYFDLSPDHPAYALFASYHSAKESMAQSARTSDLSPTGITKNRIF